MRGLLPGAQHQATGCDRAELSVAVGTPAGEGRPPGRPARQLWFWWRGEREACGKRLSLASKAWVGGLTSRPEGSSLRPLRFLGTPPHACFHHSTHPGCPGT